MVVAVADTHAVVWYLAVDKRLSAAAKLFMLDVCRFSTGITIFVQWLSHPHYG